MEDSKEESVSVGCIRITSAIRLENSTTNLDYPFNILNLSRIKERKEDRRLGNNFNSHRKLYYVLYDPN